MPSPEDRPVRLLISFSPEDRELKGQLVRHLQVLVRFTGIDLWTADRVQAGDNWRQEIDVALDRADVALLLISADFLASDFLQDVEVPKLLQRREHGGLKVIPVLLRSCLWQAHPWLGALKPLPISKQSIASLVGDDRDRALTEIVAEIEQHMGVRSAAQPPSEPPGVAPVRFASIMMDRNDANWAIRLRPGSRMFANIGAVGTFCKEFVMGEADPTLDITIVNSRREPLLLLGVGVRIVSVAYRIYVTGIPSAAKIFRSDSYAIEIPNIGANQRIEWPWSGWGPSAVDRVVSLLLPDPVYLEGLAPYRYSLLLKNFDRHLPNHTCISLLAMTDGGEAVSWRFEMSG